MISNTSTSTISQTNETEMPGYDNHNDLEDWQLFLNKSAV